MTASPYRPASDTTRPLTSDVLMSLEGIGKDYVTEAVTVHALRSVDLTIRRGEFVAIVGQSGSGKSTMMNIIGCLDRPTRGRYVLDGIDVTHRSNDARAVVRNRLIGFVFQGFNLLPRTTALENVELPLVYRGVPSADRKKRALQALTSVNLGERLHHTPNQLSGGQQQRVAIARALVTEPPLLLADEPTGNLDTRTSLEVLALLQDLNRKQGITICLVTHEPDIAACANRVISMRDGRVRSDTANASPHDALGALAELPPVEDGP
jgi:putative ABC transport system ATP-binding protein